MDAGKVKTMRSIAQIPGDAFPCVGASITEIVMLPKPLQTMQEFACDRDPSTSFLTLNQDRQGAIHRWLRDRLSAWRRGRSDALGGALFATCKP